MANNINIVITTEDKGSKPIRQFADEVDGASDKSSKFKSVLGSLGGALRSVALVGTTAALSFGTAGAALGLGFNSSVEQASAKLNAFMKDNSKVAETLEWVKKEAADTQFSFTDMANAAADLTPVSKATGKSLQDLVKQAEVLAALNPAEGLTGAVFSLREALGGDWVSIVDRFNLPRQRLNELKAQGVPAMEAISTALQEMGIDYDLVSKQGQTAAARWDQIKDKFTMAFGRATEPLFKKISEGLDGLNKVDFDALGENLAKGMQIGLDAVKNIEGGLKVIFSGKYKADWFAGLDENHPVVKFLQNIHNGLKQAWEFLRPAFEELAKVFETQLKPALEELWQKIEPQLLPALEILVKIVGVVLVGALLILVKSLTAVVEIISATVRAVTWISDTFAGFVQTVVETTYTAGYQIGKFFSDLPTNLGNAIGQITAKLVSFVSVDLPNFINSTISWFQQLPSRVAQSLYSLWGTASGALSEFWNNAVQWAAGVVNTVVSFFNTLPQRIMGALSGATGDVSSWLSKFTKGFNIGINAHASGTNSAPGGLSRINEHGPEIVNMPRGAEVIPAYRSRDIMQGGGPDGRSGPLVVIENYNSSGQSDDNRFFRDIGFYLELAS